MTSAARAVMGLAFAAVPTVALAGTHLNLTASAGPEGMAVEDVDSSSSDADLNDAHLVWAKQCRVEIASDRVDQERYHLTGAAAGAQFTNGLALVLDAQPASIVFDAGDGLGPHPLTAEVGPRGWQVRLTPDFDDLFASVNGTFVNTQGPPFALGRQAEVVVGYAAGTGPVSGGACSPARFALVRPGVFIDEQTHLPANNQPLAARLPADWQVPVETVAVSTAYPQFMDWVTESITPGACDPACPHATWYGAPGTDIVARTGADLPTLDALPTCVDNVRNQDEAGVDCGGLVCDACASAAPIEPQHATLTVDLGTGQVAIDQPTVLGLSATARFDGAAGSLEVDLTVTNDAPRLLFGLKALTRSATEGFQVNRCLQSWGPGGPRVLAASNDGATTWFVYGPSAFNGFTSANGSFLTTIPTNPPVTILNPPEVQGYRPTEETWLEIDGYGSYRIDYVLGDAELDMGVEFTTRGVPFGLTGLTYRITRAPIATTQVRNCPTPVDQFGNALVDAQGNALSTVTDGSPTTYFGPAALDVGASETRTLRFTGVTGSQDPFVIQLDLVENPLLLAGWDLIDLASGISYEKGYEDVNGYDQSGTWTWVYWYNRASADVALDPTGRFYVTGNKNGAMVFTIDLTTLAVIQSAYLGSAPIPSPFTGGANTLAGSVKALTLLDDGRLIVGLNDGPGHFSGGDGLGVWPARQFLPNDLSLQVLDPATLAPSGAPLALPQAFSSGVIQGIFPSPDQQRLAVLVRDGSTDEGSVWFIDADPLSVIDVDAVTPGDQPVLLSARGFTGGRQEDGAWSPDGGRFFVGFQNGGTTHLPTDRPEDLGQPWTRAWLEVVDTTTYLVSSLALQGANGSIGDLRVRDGKLYATTFQGDLPGSALTIVDLGTGDQWNPATSGADPMTQGMQIVFHPYLPRYYVLGNGALQNSGRWLAGFDAADDTMLDLDGDRPTGDGYLTRFSSNAHVLEVTPF